MNRLSIYILLIFTFLGLSKSFSPSEHKSIYIENERVIASFFTDSPLTIILEDSFQAGFIIRTYFQKYLIVHGFRDSEKIVVRTSKEFWQKNIKNIGMSLFRRSELNNTHNNFPMPPGLLFVGDPSFGYWHYQPSGDKHWQFYRAYKKFYKLFRWGDFRASYSFLKTARNHLKSEKPFYGLKEEFGKNGSLSKKLRKNLLYDKEKDDFNFIEHFKKKIVIQLKSKQLEKKYE